MTGPAHTGQCRCGEVRFTAQGAPLVTMACHCRGCQRMSSSAFSLSSLYPADRFQVENGETVRGGVGTGPSHMFCPTCMSWLFTMPEGLEGFVNVRSTMFEDATEHRPFIETYRAEGFDWASSGAARTYETAPEDSEFSDLVTAYGEWDGRVKQ